MVRKKVLFAIKQIWALKIGKKEGSKNSKYFQSNAGASHKQRTNLITAQKMEVNAPVRVVLWAMALSINQEVPLSWLEV
jgi:hypothetical protein